MDKMMKIVSIAVRTNRRLSKKLLNLKRMKIDVTFPMIPKRPIMIWIEKKLTIWVISLNETYQANSFKPEGTMQTILRSLVKLAVLFRTKTEIFKGWLHFSALGGLSLLSSCLTLIQNLGEDLAYKNDEILDIFGILGSCNMKQISFASLLEVV